MVISKPVLAPVPQRQFAWKLAIAVCLVLQLIIAACSIGSNDAFLFHTFALELKKFGLIGTYQLDGLFNHPPLVALWTRIALDLSELCPRAWGELHTFAFIFKLPVIAANGVGAWLVWRIWTSRVSSDRASAIAASSAWSLLSIAIGAYHCNTDPIYATLCLAAVFAMEERQAYFLGGLLLAAAINVKLIPVLLIPGLLLSCRSIREARSFFLGLSLGVIPFLPLLIWAGPSFCHNVLNYNSNVNSWGVMCVLLANPLVHGVIGASTSAVETYHSLGRYLMFSAIGAWAIIARQKNRWTRYEIAAVTFALFLALTPGFGIQYLIMLGPLLFAIRPRLGAVYGLAAGAFASALYVSELHSGAVPWYSLVGRFSLGVSLVGLIAWAVIVCFLCMTLWPRRAQRDESISTGQPIPASYTSARAA